MLIIIYLAQDSENFQDGNINDRNDVISLFNYPDAMSRAEKLGDICFVQIRAPVKLLRQPSLCSRNLTRCNESRMK